MPENPAFNFALHQPGKITYFNEYRGGNGLRIESAMFAGNVIPNLTMTHGTKIITESADRTEGHWQK